MLFDIVALILEPDGYVCTWRDGELFIETVAVAGAATGAG
jgi:hypothetical protein